MLTALCAAVVLAAWIYLALCRGLFWLPVVDGPAPIPVSWPEVTIVVPARNEADSLPRALSSLLAQDYPGRWRVILVDDHSTDGTGHIARQLSFSLGKANRLSVISAPDLPEGWSGKVAAMQAGLRQSFSDYVLFTDADIEHAPDSLKQLMARASHNKLDMASLMVKLHCDTLVERLLIPAFVHFFALLYPFRKVNDFSSPVAAAAGGVMLIKRKALENAGGLVRIKPALIDDCALARIIKDNGGPDSAQGRIRLTLTHNLKSLRVYPKLADVTDMISRTAFTQLRHSPWLLGATVVGMLALFYAPILALLVGSDTAILLGFVSMALMAALYWPMTRFYGLHWSWSLTLPVAASIYIMATVKSAVKYWQGQGGQWKGRAQAR